MLHHLWGKAKEHPDYDKEEWKELQRRYDALITAAEAAIRCTSHLMWVCPSCRALLEKAVAGTKVEHPISIRTKQP